MPSLFEMLADSDAKDALKKIQKEEKSNKGHSKTHAPKKTHTPPSSGTFKVKIPDFIALDLETTGLDRRSDRITEIGAVKYINGEAVETFSTLVNPGKPISEFITRITGITNEMVSTAPTFAEVADQILEFIGRLAFCGHQVDFDFNFLNDELVRMGKPKIRNWQIDTLSIARLVLDSDEGYALGKVALKLGVPLENAHRALDDAKASGDIALKLLPKLGELPIETRAKLAEMAPFSFTRKILESSVRNYKPKARSKKVAPNLPSIAKPLESSDQNFLITPQAVQELFAQEGPLASKLPSYQERSNQIEYAQAVATTLNSGTISALEAGTGTGKTMGYLLPAASWALGRGEQVIITTATKNLQEQIVQKELPLIKTILEKEQGDEIRFTTLKGRNNYLCIKGWESLLSGEVGNLSLRERGAMLPLIRWVDETSTGDIEEQNTFNRNFHKQIWSLISAENKRCGGCKYFEPCYLQRARKKARASHIVVANHALFYSDLTSGGELSENAGALIIDEAHQLEGWGHKMLTRTIDTKRADTFVEVAQQLLTSIQPISKDSTNEPFRQAVGGLKKAIKITRKYNKETIAAIVDWSKENLAQADFSGKIYTIGYHNKPFSHVEALAGLNIALDEMIDALSLLRQVGIDELSGSLAGSELISVESEAQQIRADYRYLTDANTEGDVFWIEAPENGKWIKMMGTTVDVSTFLSQFWKQLNKPVVFTSATLSPSGKLDYFASRIGIDQHGPNLSAFPTSFKPENQLFTGLSYAPLPNEPGYAQFIATLLFDLRESQKKNTLVLFTSNAFLKEVFDLMQKTADHDLPYLFAQGISGNRSWIQQQMSEVKGAILLGSGSFWEGVDIPGDGCEIVVIPKLPFPVPSHPLTKAIAAKSEESGKNSFMSYFMPEALLKFRQGTGRLIRHHNDRGALIVADGRMLSKGYGKRFSKLVPSELTVSNTTETLLSNLDTFFEGDIK